ncbi:globin-like [Physella acuta]|uniref:globin-like n=1 Tax=Physella acuta TaxID=109671 RepID=UPI0027DBC726|nr:globin-like [Physella acuta]
MKGKTKEQLYALGMNLVLWMLVEVPDIKMLFRKFNAHKKQVELKADQVFVDHTVLLIKLLDELVTNLPDTEKFNLIVKRMCEFHLNITPHAGSVYFEPFRDKFHLFLRHYPDLEADDEDIELWTEFFNVICQIIKAEEAKLAPPKEKSKFGYVSSDQSEAETAEGSDATEATTAESSQASEKCIVTGFTAK